MAWGKKKKDAPQMNDKKLLTVWSLRKKAAECTENHSSGAGIQMLWMVH